MDESESVTLDTVPLSLGEMRALLAAPRELLID
jgi:hypothetical protein